MSQADFGVYGLGVMGFNLGRNIQRNGFKVAVYNRSKDKVEAFVEGSPNDNPAIGADSLPGLVALLKRPRRILVMIPAGPLLDDAIGALKPYLEKGDILIDGGNSFFLDTERRSKALEGEGFAYVGMGVSGGEEGALWGPSLMPGGSLEAWQALKPILEAIAAKAGDGQPCVSHIGPRGAGHYVKMIHNGIEYGDMQLIAEVYDILRRGMALPNEQIGEIFGRWNEGVLRSYLIEITAQVLARKDEETGLSLVDLIVDEAGQKGTGKWTGQNAFDLGAPIPTINAAIDSRNLSRLKNERVQASQAIRGPQSFFSGDPELMINALRDALYASKVTSYAQGMWMLKTASEEYGYELKPGELARIWRAGCIIRADLLNDITTAYQINPHLNNLLLNDAFRMAVESRQSAWRFVIQQAVGMGIPVLALGASLAYFDGYRSEKLPANLTQAQRDFFGAHTYHRLDKSGTFHTEWLLK